VLSARTAYVAGFYESMRTRKRLQIFALCGSKEPELEFAGGTLDRLFTAPAMIRQMKEPQTLALKLMILVVIGTLATGLNLTISLQDTISLSWWGGGRAPHPGFAGWPTLAFEAAILSIVALWGGYKAETRGPLAINALIIASAALAIFGLVVYSRMAPVSDLRIPDDLRSRASQLFFAFVPELLAQLIAQMGVGAVVGRFLASDEPHLKGERPTAAP
jgi:hypothetical protein